MVYSSVWDNNFSKVVEDIEVTEDSKFDTLKLFMQNYADIYEKVKGVTRALRFKVNVTDRQLHYTLDGEVDTFDKGTVELMRREALLSYLMSQQDESDRLEYKNSTYPNIELIAEYCQVDSIQKFIDSDLEVPLTLGKYYNNKYSNEAYTLNELAIINNHYNTNIKRLRRNYLHRVLDSAYDRGEKNVDIDRFIYLSYLFTIADNKYNTNGRFDYSRLPSFGKRDRYLVGTPNGERLASKNEIKNKSPRMFTKKEYAVSPEKYKMLCIIAWLDTGKDMYASMGGIAYKRIEVNRVKTAYKEIQDALLYFTSDAFENDMNTYIEFSKPIAYPDSIEGEDVQEVSVEKMLKYIKAHLDSVNEYDNIALSIAKSAIRYKNYNLSEKQLKIVNNVYYKMIDGKPQTAIGRENKYDEELRKDILVILQKTNRRSTVYSICESVLNSHSCSARQYEVIQDRLREIAMQDTNRAKSMEEDLADNIYSNSIGLAIESCSMRDGVYEAEENDVSTNADDVRNLENDMIPVDDLSDILGSGSILK